MNRHTIGIAALVLVGSICAQSHWSVVPAGGSSYGRRAPFRATSFDIGRNRLVAFDGALDWLGTPPGETWEFDGTVWHNVSAFPAPRSGGVLMYDPSRLIHVYMPGGNPAGPAPVQEVWEWDGRSWTDRTPATGPVERHGGTIAYDPVNQGMLLFGGHILQPYTPPPVETWLWTGSRWRQLSPSRHPPGTLAPGMVTDWSRDRIILYGVEGPLPPEVWFWDGVDWTAVPGSGHPSPPRELFSMVFDVVRDRVVLTGGYGYVGSNTTMFTETWEFDGVQWTLLPVSIGPSCMQGAGLAYDPVGERVLLVGGSNFDRWATCYNTAVWQLRTSSPASYVGGGTGCVGSVGLPALTPAAGSRPWLGCTLDVDLVQSPAGAPASMATGFSTTTWGQYALPLDLGFVGAPGCPLRVAPSVWFPFAAGLAGTLRWSLAIPNDPALAGMRFHNQALVLDPGANALGAVLSNVATGTIGIR